MNVFTIKISSVIAGLICLAAATEPAKAYPALYVSEVTMGVPPEVCANAGSKDLGAAGFTNLYKDGPSNAGGTTPTTRGYIVCVPLPKAGSCGGTGSTAVIMTAGDDALPLNKALTEGFHKPVLIDCN